MNRVAIFHTPDCQIHLAILANLGNLVRKGHDLNRLSKFPKVANKLENW